jgi:hypothetical protein
MTESAQLRRSYLPAKVHVILKVHKFKFIGTNEWSRTENARNLLRKCGESAGGCWLADDLVVRWTQPWLRAQRWEIHCSIRCHWTLLFISENIKQSLAYHWGCFPEKHCGRQSSYLLDEGLGCWIPYCEICWCSPCVCYIRYRSLMHRNKY